ncbi:MAG: hypothetical protein IPH18_12610 [Chitinophagaceae bacterium]|nr:hypothetical protein [Chitinophagaceae bacterium]
MRKLQVTIIPNVDNEFTSEERISLSTSARKYRGCGYRITNSARPSLPKALKSWSFLRYRLI